MVTLEIPDLQSWEQNKIMIQFFCIPDMKRGTKNAISLTLHTVNGSITIGLEEHF